jgi:hypothetical protein
MTHASLPESAIFVHLKVGVIEAARNMASAAALFRINNI